MSQRNERSSVRGTQGREKLRIGLDFGTSNTSMALSRKTRVDVLRNNRGETQTPSIVAFDGKRILIGDETNASTIRPENIIFGMKRFLGRTSAEIKRKYLDLPFYVNDSQGKPMITVDDKQFHVEQIVAILLGKLKETVESNHGVLGMAVLTVPPSFGPFQRRALMDAAAIAEIPVQLIEETTAAAIAFAHRKYVKESRNVLIFQLGGGHIDIALFRIAGYSIELLSSVTSGDIGGEDFTQQILDYALRQQIFERAKNIPKARMQMRAASEKAKHGLTLGKEAKIKVDSNEVKYSRHDFETGNKYFKIIEWMIEFVIGKARIDSSIVMEGSTMSQEVGRRQSIEPRRDSIHNYFVAGRSSIMPTVKNMLKKYIGEEKRKDIVNAGDAAVSGAAILAEKPEMDLRVSDTKKKIAVADGKVTSEFDQAFTSSEIARRLKKIANTDRSMNMEFIVRSQVPPGQTEKQKARKLSGNRDVEPATTFSEEEMGEMIEEVKKCLEGDNDWLVMDGDKIQLSGDIHETEDEIEERLQRATDRDKIKKLQSLQKQCKELDDWICNVEGVSTQELEKCKKQLEEIRKNLKQPKPPGTRVIGIDLGTTNSCVAAMVNGREEVFKNDSGNVVTPSCVAFIKDQVLIGEPAKRQMTQEPENTILSVKRIIGRKYDDPKTQQDLKNWQFKVDDPGNKRPVIKINHRNETYNVEEISGLVLDYMRRIACKKLDKDVRDAVVTVPAYFNHMQRTATKTAAELAGLNVLRIINEPTAAAIAFGLGKHSGYKNILVYDFGGGTFDVTVLSINGSNFDVKATSGDTHLGGDDLTNSLRESILDGMKPRKANTIKSNKCAMNRLWMECEEAKIRLSEMLECDVLVENVANGITVRENINRSTFVSLNKVSLDKTLKYVEDAIYAAGMTRNDIHFVVPVGGSCRIPYVIGMLKKYFGKNVLKNNVSPELAIARGAAVYADQLKNNSGQQKSKLILSEVTPLSLGIKVISQKSSVIIKRNTKIKAKKTKIHYSALDYQKSAVLPVCQGEKELFEDNEYLGKYELQITPKPKGEVKVDVEFSLDLDGVLHAKATEIGVGRSNGAKIDLCGTLKKLNISDLKQKLEKLTSDGERCEYLQEKKSNFESNLNEIKNRYKQLSQVVQKCNEILEWLGWEHVTMLGIQEKQKEIEDVVARVRQLTPTGKGSVKKSKIPGQAKRTSSAKGTFF